MHAAVLLFAVAIKSIGVIGPITGSQDTAGQVHLTGDATLAVETVTLQSNLIGIAQVPESVVAKDGVATFKVRTFPVKTPTDVTITAKIGASSKSTSLRVMPPVLSVIGCNIPPNVSPQVPLHCTVWLDGLAPDDTPVALSSSLPAAVVPPSVTIRGNTNKEFFQVIAQPIAQSATAQISATYAGATKNTNVNIMPVALENVAFSSDHVVGGNQVQLSIKLTAPPPGAGLVVKFAKQVVGGDTSVPNVLSLFGSFVDKDQLHTLPIPTYGVSTPTTVQVLASTDFAPNDVKTLRIHIDPATMQNLTIEPDHLSHVPLGGQQVKVVLWRNGSEAPSDVIDRHYGGDTQIVEASPPVAEYSNATTWHVTVSPCSVQPTCTVWVKVRYHGVERTATATVTQ